MTKHRVYPCMCVCLCKTKNCVAIGSIQYKNAFKKDGDPTALVVCTLGTVMGKLSAQL